MDLLKHRIGHWETGWKNHLRCCLSGALMMPFTSPRLGFPLCDLEELVLSEVPFCSNTWWCSVCFHCCRCLLRRELGRVFLLLCLQCFLWLGRSAGLFSLRLHGEHNTQERPASPECWHDQGLGAEAVSTQHKAKPDLAARQLIWFQLNRGVFFLFYFWLDASHRGFRKVDIGAVTAPSTDNLYRSWRSRHYSQEFQLCD